MHYSKPANLNETVRDIHKFNCILKNIVGYENEISLSEKNVSKGNI